MQTTLRGGPGRVWLSRMALAIAIAFALKSTLALTTYGTNDVDTWEHFLAALQEGGGASVYRRYDVFNHPPFVLHLLNAMGSLANVTGILFPFWLRLPAIVADVGSAAVLWKLFKLEPVIPFSRVNLTLMAVAPASAMIAGFHGNTDPVMIFLLLLCIYLVTSGQSVWLAGAAFGMSANIKVVPLIALPAIVLFLPDMRKRLGFCVAALLAFALSSSPYILDDPVCILRRVLGYDSLPGQWGMLRLLTLLPANAHWLGAVYAGIGRYLVIGFVCAVSLWMNWRQPRPPLFQQRGLIMALFMNLTPGFGVQYLAWLVPWVITAGLPAALAYYISSGVFLVYTFWSGGFPWQIANSSAWPPPIVFFEVVCWASVVLVLLVLAKALLITPGRRHKDH